MNNSLLTTFQSLWLYGWLLVWAGLLFGGLVLGRYDPAKEYRMPTWTRLASSVALVIAGWSWYGFSLGGSWQQLSDFCFLLALGMTLGALGDFFMAGVIPPGQNTLGGMAAFGLGHIAYILAAFRLANQQGRDLVTGGWWAWLGWGLFGVTGWYLVVLRGRKASPLHLAALPYTLLLASTAASATSLAGQLPALWPFAVGATLFLLSDLLLAARLFNGLQFRSVGDLVWLLYGPGQALIVYSVAGALTLIGNPTAIN